MKKDNYHNNANEPTIPYINGRKVTDFLGSTFVSTKKIKVFKLPDINSAVIAEYDKGKNVGVIYSYVVRNGQIWYQLNWFSGNHQGWTPAIQGIFDTEIAQKSSEQLKTEKEIAKMKEDDTVLGGVGSIFDGLGNTFSLIGDNLPLIVVGIGLYLIFRK